MNEKRMDGWWESPWDHLVSLDMSHLAEGPERPCLGLPDLGLQHHSKARHHSMEKETEGVCVQHNIPTSQISKERAKYSGTSSFFHLIFLGPKQLSVLTRNAKCMLTWTINLLLLARCCVKMQGGSTHWGLPFSSLLPCSHWNLGSKLSAFSIKQQNIFPINLCPGFCFS